MARGKVKVDFTDPDNLLVAEGLARDGLDNKDIAKHFDYEETYFSNLVNSKPQLSQALKRGRKPLEIVVENSLYRRAIGGGTVTSITRRCIEMKCPCGGDPKCEMCYGAGVILTDKVVIQEVESVLPPDVGAAALWLKQKKSDVWNKQPLRIDTTTNGKDITSKEMTPKEAREYIRKLEEDN